MPVSLVGAGASARSFFLGSERRKKRRKFTGRLLCLETRNRVTETPLLDIVSHGAEQTRRLGAHLGAAARPGDIILLEGEFGAGKTTFTQGIARGLGLDAHYVNSPTFTLINEYKGPRGRLYHVDLYRL